MKVVASPFFGDFDVNVSYCFSSFVVVVVVADDSVVVVVDDTKGVATLPLFVDDDEHNFLFGTFTLSSFVVADVPFSLLLLLLLPLLPSISSSR